MTAVIVRGGRQLRSTLKKAGVDMKQLTAINRQAATTVATAARPLTPVRTGALAASVRPGATQRAGVIRAGKKAVPYGGPIHWGWPARNIPANPFLSNAAQATEGIWVPRFEAHMNDIVNSVKGA